MIKMSKTLIIKINQGKHIPLSKELQLIINSHISKNKSYQNLKF